MKKTHEANDNIKDLELAKQVSKAFSNYMICVAKAQSIDEGIDVLIDPKLSDLFLNSTHEGRSFE